MGEIRWHLVSLALVGVFAALSGPALAQDWSGAYAGVNLGAAWGNSDAKTTTGCPATNPPGYVCSQSTGSFANAAVVDAAGSGAMHPKDVTGGFQAGYNLQNGSFVYGVEADFGRLKLNSTRIGSGQWVIAGPANFAVGSLIDTDWLLTARGRLGWTVSNVLIYATGGLALTDMRVGNDYIDNLAGGANTERSTNDALKAGWTVGGGLEVALDEHWSLKGEYLFVAFGDVSSTGIISSAASPQFANPISISEDLTAQLARAGLNYRF